MSELPSRDSVRHSNNIHDFPTYMEKVLLPLAFAWRSGRLIDRENIDTVWLCVEKSNDTAGWRVTNQPGSPAFCYFSGGAHTPWCGPAALGIGDNGEQA